MFALVSAALFCFVEPTFEFGRHLLAVASPSVVAPSRDPETRTVTLDKAGGYVVVQSSGTDDVVSFVRCSVIVVVRQQHGQRQHGRGPSHWGTS
jgi:hypothetical protein